MSQTDAPATNQTLTPEIQVTIRLADTAAEKTLTPEQQAAFKSQVSQADLVRLFSIVQQVLTNSATQQE